jgi:peroxiredoxin
MTEPRPPSPLSRAWAWTRAKWYRRWALDLVIIIFVMWLIGRYQSRKLLDDAHMAPAFSLPDLDGRVVSLDDFLGKKVLIQFFAPWCTVCSLESDNWARVQKLRDDIAVIAVALAYEDKGSVEGFVGDDRLVYPVLLGTDAVQSAYRVESFPTFYILDEEGRITSQSVGYTTTAGLLLRLL